MVYGEIEVRGSLNVTRVWERGERQHQNHLLRSATAEPQQVGEVRMPSFAGRRTCCRSVEIILASSAWLSISRKRVLHTYTRGKQAYCHSTAILSGHRSSCRARCLCLGSLLLASSQGICLVCNHVELSSRSSLRMTGRAPPKLHK